MSRFNNNTNFAVGKYVMLNKLGMQQNFLSIEKFRFYKIINIDVKEQVFKFNESASYYSFEYFDLYEGDFIDPYVKV